MQHIARALASASMLGILLAGTAAGGPQCESGEAALRTAALQQYLMVAALTCHREDAYNNFVVSHQKELQRSDRDLLIHFKHRDRRSGDDNYNAYKTWLANTSSMRSLHEPQFCQDADTAFVSAADGVKPLVQIVSEQPMPADVQADTCREPSKVRQASLNRR